MRKTLILIAFTISTLICRASLLEGIVKDAAGTPLQGATCAVYTLPDSVMSACATTDAAGHFSVDTPQDTHWYLEASCVGYNPEVIEAADTDTPIDFTLSPKSTELGEVVVRAGRPQLTMHDDMFSYDVRPIIEQRVVMSAHDVLKELPLVQSPDGTQLKLSGARQGTVVYLNGRRSAMSEEQLMEYLKSVPADRLAGVDLVYEPTPKWKTRSSVLNVRIRRHTDTEISGMLQTWGQYKWMWSGGAAGNALLSTPRLDVSVMYAPSSRGSKWRQEDERRHTYGGETHLTYDTLESRTVTRAHNVYASADYKIDTDNSVELSYSGTFSPSSDNRRADAGNLTGKTLMKRHTETGINTAILSYSGRRASAAVEYTHFASPWHQRVTDETGGVYGSDARQFNNRLRVYADLTAGLPRGMSLSYGASYEHTHSRNTQRGHSDIASMPVSDFTSSSDEHIIKGYVGVRGQTLSGRLSASVSVSAESHSMDAHRDFQVFPTAVCSFSASPRHMLQASYSTYQLFPSYWEKQDYSYFASPYYLYRGNPSLGPARYHVGSLRYVLGGKYSASATYYRVNGFNTNVPFMSPEHPYIIYQPFNLDFSETWSLTLTAPFSVGQKLFTTLELAGNVEKYRSGDWHGVAFDKSNANLIFRMYNTLVLSKSPGISLSLNGWYRTPSLYVIEERGRMISLNGGVTLTLLGDRLGVSVYANDILGMATPTEWTSVAGQYSRSYFNFHETAVSLSLSYRFNGYRERGIRNGDTSRYGLR